MPMASKADILFKMTGDRALNARLQRLSAGTQNRIARPALQKMLRVIAKAQKAKAPHPVVKRSIGFRLGRSKGKDMLTAKAGINVGKSAQRLTKNGTAKRGGTVNQVAHLLTLGTVPRFTGQTTRAKGKRGKLVATGGKRRFTGSMKEHKFLKEASEGAWPEAVRVGRQSAWDGIIRLL
jgi:hypothetical protein